MEKFISSVMANEDPYKVYVSGMAKDAEFSLPMLEAVLVSTRHQLTDLWDLLRDLYEKYPTIMHLQSEAAKELESEIKALNEKFISLIDNISCLIVYQEVPIQVFDILIRADIEKSNLMAIYYELNFMQTLKALGTHLVIFEMGIPLLRMSEFTATYSDPTKSRWGFRNLGRLVWDVKSKVSNDMFVKLSKMERVVRGLSTDQKSTESPELIIRTLTLELLESLGIFLAVSGIDTVYVVESLTNMGINRKEGTNAN